MSTESESTVLDGSNGSKIEVKSESLAEPMSGREQELEAKLDRDEQEGCVTAEPSADDLGKEKLIGSTDLPKEKESVNGGLDLAMGSINVDGETKESEEKVPDDSKEVATVNGVKDSDGIQTELLVDKDMVSSHGAKLSDLFEDSKQDSENLDSECFMGLEAHESKDESSLDNETSPVTAKVKLSDSDLVWAKVRSHPWWPGQLFNASAATDKAKKYFKKGSYLVTYFGDCSFAWNDASRIKPFRENFSQMSKQSSLPDFLDAVDFALEEVSRRIEFCLACSCISEEVYEEIKTQNVINPGIREDSSSIYGGDKVSSAVFFEPANLVDYVKRLACSPSYNVTDGELQFVSQRARLLAFNRWKGYSDLPEFEILQGSVESAPKISPAEEESSRTKKVSVPEPKKTTQVYTKKRKTEGQDGVFEYEDGTVPKKKEKTLAEFIAEKRLSRSSGKRSHEKSEKKPDCEKKRKVVNAELPKSSKKIKADLRIEDSGSPLSPKNDRKCNLSAGDKVTPKKAKTSFGIGASILRVANQMHCSTPTGPIPCSNSTSKMVAKNNGSGKSLQGRLKAEALSETKSSPKPSTNLVEGSVLDSTDLKGSSKDQMVSIESNLTEEKITGSDLKEQPGNKNCSE